MSKKTNCIMMLCFSVLVLVGGGCKSEIHDDTKMYYVFESNWTPLQILQPLGRNADFLLVKPTENNPLPTVFGGNFGFAQTAITNLYGINYGAYAAITNLYGISFTPLLSILYQYNVGVSISSLYYGCTKSALNAGVIFAPLQLCYDILNAGILGGIVSMYQINYGVSFGLFNGHFEKGANYGLQTGLINSCDIDKGLSIGLVNYVSCRGEGITGFQIGLINYCDGLVMPFFMFSGGGKAKPSIDWSSEISEERSQPLQIN